MSKFEYVAFDEESKRIQQWFKERVEELESMLQSFGPSCEKHQAVCRLEESYMWAGKCIRNAQVKRELIAKQKLESEPIFDESGMQIGEMVKTQDHIEPEVQA